jgi:hypothetical protein
MAIPEQARFTTPVRSPKTETDHSQNWSGLEQKWDRLPVFHEYLMIDDNGIPAFSTATPVDTTLRIDTFQKFADWTDITFRLTVGMYSTAVSAIARFEAYVYGLNDNTTLVATIPLIRFYFNQAGIHVSVSGAGRQTTLPAGPYRIVLMAYNSGAGTVTSDANDRTVFSAQETIPVPPRLD